MGCSVKHFATAEHASTVAKMAASDVHSTPSVAILLPQEATMLLGCFQFPLCPVEQLRQYWGVRSWNRKGDGGTGEGRPWDGRIQHWWWALDPTCSVSPPPFSHQMCVSYEAGSGLRSPIAEWKAYGGSNSPFSSGASEIPPAEYSQLGFGAAA